MSYMPSEIKELQTPIELLIPTYKEVSGKQKKNYPKNGDLIFCNWKTYGGTESVVDGLLTIIDTADVVTYFRPDIKSDCRVVLLSDNSIYEILGRPENIGQENKYIKFKVRNIGGNA